MIVDTAELIETHDAAQLLQLSRDGVHYLVRRGVLPLVGRTRRGVRLFSVEDVERVARERRRARESGAPGHPPQSGCAGPQNLSTS